MGRFSSTLHICCNITEGHPPSTSQKCMSLDLSTLSRFTSLHNAIESSVSGSGLWPVRPIRFVLMRKSFRTDRALCYVAVTKE